MPGTQRDDAGGGERDRKKLRARPERRFLLRLALALGIPSPRELLKRITSRELSEWIAYFEIEPFGSVADDLRTGIIAATVANFSEMRRQDGEVWKPSDFMIDRVAEPEEAEAGEFSPRQRELLREMNEMRLRAHFIRMAEGKHGDDS